MIEQYETFCAPTPVRELSQGAWPSYLRTSQLESPEQFEEAVAGIQKITAHYLLEPYIRSRAEVRRQSSLRVTSIDDEALGIFKLGGLYGRKTCPIWS
jgi:hypothetical protein